MPTLHAIDFLAETKPGEVPGVCVSFGGEALLKRLVIAELKKRVLPEADAEFSLTTLDGATAAWRDVGDELSTVSMFSAGLRLVVVERADDFVSKHRPQLEDYAAQPSSAGVLVLAADSWPGNTRLYKALDKNGLQIECNSPPEAKLIKWLGTWARSRYGAKLEREAIEQLLEIVGPELGVLDQELAKLSAATGGGAITAESVEQLVHGGRTKTAWEMLDAALAGQAPKALDQLDRLLLAGESPIGLLAQIGSSLRRFATATRAIEQAEAEGRRMPLRTALERAGFKPFILNKAESQIKQLGRARAGKLYTWLLDSDLALKGSSSSPARSRIVLEQLIARVAAK
jgi:DNA polymerase-3 subunit delta